MQCEYVMRDGARCRAPATTGKRLCYLHGLTPQDRQENARRAGLARRPFRIVGISLKTPEDADRLLARVALALAADRISLKRAKETRVAVEAWQRQHEKTLREAREEAERRARAQSQAELKKLLGDDKSG
jgi:hypothetical protein